MFPLLLPALTICKMYSGIDNTDTTWDIPLTTFLEASKAHESYRPLIVAALQVLKFSSGITRAGIESADGVKWLNPEQVKQAIEGYLLEQEALDGDLTGIPNNWSVAVLRPKLCACQPSVVMMSAMVV